MNKKSLAILGCVATLALLSACGRNDIKVYRVAKETAQGTPPQGDFASASSGGGSPKLQWKLPSGWQETTPGEMRLASFKVSENGKQADIGVFPLPGMAGRDPDNVNRWRGQIGLEPISEEEVAKQAQAVEIAGQPGQLYDLAGTNPGSGDKARILAAILRRDGVAWFFKMNGDDQLVTEQKPHFIEFLKSLTFPASSAMSELPPSHPPIDGTSMAAAGPSAGGATSSAHPAWTVPAGWQEVPAGQFLVAKYLISGEQGSQAAVNVSQSAGDGGGLASNINRWRKQLGLAEVGDSEISKLTTSVDTEAGKAMLVDMAGTDARTGQKARLVAAIMPGNNQTWFFKLMGNEKIVEEQKGAFTKFLQTAKTN